ncbi:MAG: hypothetical protein D3909_17460, partial [Candidatus Electrothrix sp. ATG1]|nr:hypothetical protein [Candidatus Electrothrix sp. ATG1]
MSSQIKVFFAGQIEEGADPQQVRQNLAKLHQVSLEKVEALFSGKRRVLKVFSDYAAAQKIQQVYSNAGAICSIEPPPPKEEEAVAESDTVEEPVVEEPVVEEPVVEESVVEEPMVVESKEVKPKEEGSKEEQDASDAISPNLFVSDSLETPEAKFEILTYRSLAGSDNLAVADMIHKAQHSGVRLKQVRITLNNSEAILEAGALQGNPDL